MKRMLIVDDDPAVIAALRRTVRRHLAEQVLLDTETDPMLALMRSRWQSYDVIVSDLRMPELDGLSLLTLLAAVQPDAVRVLLTASADFDSARRAINEAGVFRFLCKPWNELELVAQLRAALAHAEQQRVEAA